MPVSWLGVTCTGPVGSLAAVRVGAAEVGSVGVVFSGLGRYMLCRAEESVAVASAPRPRTRVATRVPPPARRPIASPTPTRATSPATTGCCLRSGSGTVLGRPSARLRLGRSLPLSPRHPERAKSHAVQAVVHRPCDGGFRRPVDRCTLPGMTIAVDVDLLRQHRLALLAEADEIERGSSLDPPDAGPSRR